MALCQFVSPDLVTSLSGVAAVPTFALNAANTNHFSITGSFSDNNGAACSFPTTAHSITPVLVSPEGTTTCSLLGSAASYSGVECPDVMTSTMTPGTYTLLFNQPRVAGVPDIASQIFVVASPVNAKRQDPSPTATAVPTSTSAPVSGDGTCGGASGQTCLGSIFGNCCSEYGYCGRSETHCLFVEGCQPEFGTCTTPGPVTGPPVSRNGQCGTAWGGTAQTCTGSKFGGCCSASGWCGDSEDHCLAIEGCLSDFGSCTGTIPDGPPLSKDGHCGEGWTDGAAQTCAGTKFGNCCSASGWCGDTDNHCLPASGCQSGFGNCAAPPASRVKRQEPSPTPTGNVSPDGSCGGTTGYTCAGSGLGDCCSPYGWCGDTADHCGAGCQRPFGTCLTPTWTGTAPLPTTTNKVSLDGTCGGAGEQTCLGSSFGSCCSEYGYCGSTETYCAAGCQAAFGVCNAAPAAPVAQRRRRSRVI